MSEPASPRPQLPAIGPPSPWAMLPSMKSRIALTVFLTSTPLAATGCPKPAPGDPAPADDCKKDGQACVDQPHHEGPPPIGSQSPGPEAK